MPPRPAEARAVTPGLLRAWPLPAAEGGGKESRGRVLVIGGGGETPGGVLLAAESALRAGAGKLQLVTAESVAVAVAVAVPEALVRGVGVRSDGGLDPAALDSISDLVEGADVILVGPGLVGKDSACAFTQRLLARVEVPVVLDAVAMSAVTEDASVLHHLEARAVLTPNNSELALTLGLDTDEVESDPAAATLALARQARATVTGGGERSHTASPDGEQWYDEAGGSGLGVSGSGDVKAGVVAGLLARGATPPRLRRGAPICTAPPGTGSRLVSASWAIWLGSCPPRSPSCYPSWRPRPDLR